jgi:hypothetical protein
MGTGVERSLFFAVENSPSEKILVAREMAVARSSSVQEWEEGMEFSEASEKAGREDHI